MSRTPSTTPSEDPLDDTPPRGVPPVSRASISWLSRASDGRAADGTASDGTAGDDTASDGTAPDDIAPDDTAGDGTAGDGTAPDGTAPDGTAPTRGDDEEGDGGRPQAQGGGEAGPVRPGRHHAARTRPAGRATGAGRGRHLRLTLRGRIVGAALAVAVALAGLLAWYEVEANPFGPPGRPVLVTVKSGESLSAITGAMARDGVIGTSFAFHLWTVVHGAPIVRPGTYQLRRNLPFSAAKTALAAGPNVVTLTVQPGQTLSELTNELASLPGKLAHAFSDAGKTSGVHSPFQSSPDAPLEGLVGSGSYRILPGESGHALLAQMVSRFDAQARAAGLTPATTAGGLDAYQLITLASIAQKEGYFIRYMGDVARVIFNRLAAGMHLDMTSTVLYSLGKDGGPVTPQEEQLTTPYNTYLHPGLTPTPICTPSVAALRAAVHPPAGSWLYFDLVTAKNGIMKFASTYTQQLALVQEASANDAKQSKSGSTT